MTNHSSSDSKIPDDWDAHETNEGDTFYVQRSSGLTQWEKPSSSQGSSLSSSSSVSQMEVELPVSAAGHHARNSTQLPPGWYKQDDGQGRRYYSNNETLASQWTAPEGSTGGSAST